MDLRRGFLQQRHEQLRVPLQHLHAGREVILQIFIADADERPEGLLGGQVHEEEGRDRRLSLTVAGRRVENGVSFEEVEELLLPRPVLVQEHLVHRELPVLVAPNLVDDLRVAFTLQELQVEVWVGLEQAVTAGQEEPRLGPDGRWNPFAATVADLFVIFVHVLRPGRKIRKWTGRGSAQGLTHQWSSMCSHFFSR